MSGWKNHGRYWWPYRWLVELFSAETDSMMSRLGFGLHNFGPLALLIATSGEFMSLTTPSSLSMVQISTARIADQYGRADFNSGVLPVEFYCSPTPIKTRV